MTQNNLVSVTFIVFLIQYATFCHRSFARYIHIEEVGIKGTDI